MGRLSHITVCLLLALSLAGCSAYQAMRSDEDSGGHRPDGSYVLTEEERAQDCRGLAAWIHGYAESVRKLEAQHAAEQSEAPRSILTGLARISGQRDTSSTTQAMCRQYAIMVAMNRELQDRNCAAVDLSAAIAGPTGSNPAPAEADGPARVWGIRKPVPSAGTAVAICGD